MVVVTLVVVGELGAPARFRISKAVLSKLVPHIYLQVGSPVTVTNTVVQPQTLELAGSAHVPHEVEVLTAAAVVLLLDGSTHEPHEVEVLTAAAGVLLLDGSTHDSQVVVVVLAGSTQDSHVVVVLVVAGSAGVLEESDHVPHVPVLVGSADVPHVPVPVQVLVPLELLVVGDPALHDS